MSYNKNMTAPLHPPVVYTCVTNGYDRVAAVPGDWGCRFVMFHDGSVEVPSGWEGRLLQVAGVTGIHLNRYAKMLPHRLALPGAQSLYIDGNVLLARDPGEKIADVLAQHAFAAYAHPDRDCAYEELREALRLGFVWPAAAWRYARQFRRAGLPRHAGLIEANVLFRRHGDAAVVKLGETWWRYWQGGLGRDQSLLTAAMHAVGLKAAILGHDLRTDSEGVLSVAPHAKQRTRGGRLGQRVSAELMLYRAWLP
jgi:hypothetical protein